MIKNVVDILLGNMKLMLLKCFMPNRIKCCFPQKISFKINLALDRKSKIILHKKVRARENLVLHCANGGQIEIGEESFFNRNVSINSRKNIQIGHHCLFGENVKLYDHNHKFKGSDFIKNQGFKCDDIIIGNNVWIGSNVTILKGVTIGDNVVIGANCLIKEDVADNTIVTISQVLIKAEIYRE